MVCVGMAFLLILVKLMGRSVETAVSEFVKTWARGYICRVGAVNNMRRGVYVCMYVSR